MKRLVSLVVVFILLPVSAAWATELDELLEQSREAAYTAEQIISCSTPDGVRDAVVRIAQSNGEIRMTSTVAGDIEVSSGDGGWTLSRRGGVISSASVDSEEMAPVKPLYAVEDAGSAHFLGREATVHQLIRTGVLRAELVFDDETGALVTATTFTAGGDTYCERRFVSFDPTDPVLESPDLLEAEALQPRSEVETLLPESVGGFDRLDIYEDEEGLRFAYYSDGFFSFAVFETPTTVALPDANPIQFGEGVYQRSF
ncbi:MAG: hypothetical protein V3U46_02245, partial [Acidimicrobiia bacterium]